MKPRSVKQRMENEALLLQYHRGYQDDVFESISPIKKKGLLLDSSNMSEEEFSPSSCSSVGHVRSWPAMSSTPYKEEEGLIRTPISCTYQHCAYMHKKLRERKARTLIKKRLEISVDSTSFSDLVDVVKKNIVSVELEEKSKCESYFSFEEDT